MDIRIPNLGEGAESGTVVNIFVKEGDKIRKDQTMLELENEKAVAPIPSPAGGVVKKVYVKAGDKVSVGQAVIALEEENGARQAEPVRDETPVPKSVSAERPVASVPGVPPPASPSIRKIAKDLGIDLAEVKGSEAGGRIVMADIRDYIQHLVVVPRPSAAKEKVDFSKWGPVHRTALSSLRRKIGERMTESWTTIPHVTQFDEADITELAALRKKFVVSYEKKGANLTFTPFVMKAVVAALKKFPQVNSSLDEETFELILKDYYHLGVAVDTEAGLIVPVVRDVDKKSLFEVAKELQELAEKTRQRKVALEELKGGTFTISNLGSLGVGYFTPIVNKPEVAILGVGRAKIETRALLPLALSYDHRVVDGADGARFIRAVAEALQNFKAADVKL